MEVAPGIFRLELPMPFELRHVNVFLLRDGEGFTLIDTGLQTEESRRALHQHLDALNIPVEQIRRILITHIHPDHFGLAGELREQAGAELVIHRLEVALMEPRYARAEDLVHDVADWLNKNGVPPAEAEFIKTASMAAREFVKVVEPETLLEGAERLPLDGSELEAIWTPGHSPGHCCFYWPARRLLFSGDHLLPKISPNIGLHPQSGADPLDDYLQSLTRIEQLDVDHVLPAHGDPFQDHRERIAAIRDHHEQRKRALLDYARDGGKSGWQLAGQLFHGIRDRNVFQQRLALQETLAHCQSLAVEGRLRKVVTRELVTWAAN
ncbi:MAG TPA: MBL fold metallo-hydrolase [Candidatus Acidoferrum sp.]|nr:MBL fold metallo-hydrolase [Candidatus Acidoferrum sp.]